MLKSTVCAICFSLALLVSVTSTGSGQLDGYAATRGERSLTECCWIYIGGRLVCQPC